MTGRLAARGERGVTLIEVALTSALVVALTMAALGTLDTFTRADHRQEESVTVRRDVRQALDEITHDLRRALRVTPAPDLGSDALRVTLDDASEIEWDMGSGDLRRRAGPRERVVLRDPIVGAGPLFTYLMNDGSELDPASLDAASIGACSAAVRVRFQLRSPASGATVSGTRTVQLRNYRAESAC